jgi:hypothetical protein
LCHHLATRKFKTVKFPFSTAIAFDILPLLWSAVNRRQYSYLQ